MAGVIQNLEILSAGTHQASTGTVTITEADLDKIVENFSKLHGSNIVKPHLKLGHDDAQKWFGQKNGIPALGWITKVWRAGRKLLSNVEDVPDTLLDLIRQKRYHNVSAEVYLEPIEFQGQKVSHVLSAVALLGTEMPAVKDLAGLTAALMAAAFEDKVDAPLVSVTQETTMPEPTTGAVLFSQAQVDQLIEAAVNKAVATVKAEFTAQAADSATKLSVAEKRATDAEGDIKKLKAENAQKEATRIVDAAIKDGKLLPKQRDHALAFMNMSGVVKFGDGEKSPAEVFQAFLESSGKQVDLSERGTGKNGERKDFATAAEEVDFKSKKLLSEDATGKLTYSQALDKVLSADDELKKRYVDGDAKAA